MVTDNHVNDGHYIYIFNHFIFSSSDSGDATKINLPQTTKVD